MFSKISILFEKTEEFIDESIGDQYTNYTKKITGAAVLPGLGIGMGASNIGRIANRGISHIADNSTGTLAKAAGGTALYVGGLAYILNKYRTSYLRYSRAVSKLEQKLKKDPSNKILQQKLKDFTKKREEARARSYKEEKSFIDKTKELQFKLNEMKKAKSDKKEIGKLEDRIATRKRALMQSGIEKI